MQRSLVLWCCVGVVTGCAVDNSESRAVAGRGASGSASVGVGPGGHGVSDGAGGAGPLGSSDAEAGSEASSGIAGAAGAYDAGDVEAGLPPHGWLPNVRVNDDTGRAAQVEVSLAAGTAGLILASWVDSRNGTRCAFSVSTDGGTTWGKNITVAPTGSGITGDAVAGIDASGKLYAVCQDYGVSQILLSTSSDRGSTWSGWRPIQASPDKPWVAGVRNGTIFLSWLGSPGGFKRSLDGGATWSAVTSLGTLSHGTAISPVDDGVVHVPYNQGAQVRYLRSKDFGATFDPGRNLADMGTACFGCTHAIIRSSDRG